MKLIAFKFFLLFSLFVFGSPEDESFFIFDVGQGNCQLAIYRDSKIGFLFDAGSSSKQKHPKLTGLKQDDWYPFLKKATEEVTSAPSSTAEEKRVQLQESPIDDDFDPLEEDNMSTGSDHSSGKMSLKESCPIENIEESIKEAIIKEQVEWLFVFLSHPDKDHINLINPKSIPEEVNLIAYLGGDFLGTESVTEVKKILGFLKKRSQKKNLG